MTADGWVGGIIDDDGGVGSVIDDDGWIGEVIDDGGVGSVIDDGGWIGGGIDDGGAGNGLGNTRRSGCATCLKKRGGNAWRLAPCVRFRDLSRCRSSGVVFRSTPRRVEGNSLVTHTQSI